MGHEFFQEELGKDALYKISKAYSVYDEEVGYCQGFSFMAAMLLLQVRGHWRDRQTHPSGDYGGGGGWRRLNCFALLRCIYASSVLHS